MFLILINIDTIKTDNENQMEQYFYYVYDGQNKTHLQCHIDRKLKKKFFFIYFYGMVGHSNEILYIKGNFTIFFISF